MDLTFNQLVGLIKNNRFGRYLEDPGISAIKAEEFVTKKLLNSITIGDLKCLFSFSQNRESNLKGLLTYRFSVWDTNHFEKKTVILENIIVDRKNNEFEQLNLVNNLVTSFLEACKSENVKFIVAKLPSLDLVSIHVLESKGFRFIESWIYNSFDLRKVLKITITGKLSLRFATLEDLNFMLEYSKNAFSTQRFHADYFIPNDKAESLYHKWIKTSFEDPQHKIIVADYNSIPAAFMIYYISDQSEILDLKFAMWKMALINPDLKGLGLGTRFFSSLIYYHKEEGLDFIDSGVSLRNIISLNTHNKVNFKIISTLATFHLWF